jgi:hypothetical protein
MQAGHMPKNQKIYVEMPPITEGFALPTKEDLLTIKPGEHVKLILSPIFGHDLKERMWVILKKKVSDNLWRGVLDNKPLSLPVKRGEAVTFHPLAVIATLTRAEGMRLKHDDEAAGV